VTGRTSDPWNNLCHLWVCSMFSWFSRHITFHCVLQKTILPKYMSKPAVTHMIQCAMQSALAIKKIYNTLCCDGLQQQMSRSVDDVSDIVEVERTSVMTEEERTRARYINKRRYVSCGLVPRAVRIGSVCFKAVRLPCSFIYSSRQILLPRYPMNTLNNSDKTDREYSLAILMTWLDSGGQRSRSQQRV